MSLETAIAELTAAVSTNNDLLRQMLANDAAAGGASAGEADKPKKTTAKKDTAKKEDAGTDKGGDDAVTFDTLKTALSTWLGEFAKPEDKENPKGTHPEVLERKATLKGTLEKLGANQLPDIKDDQSKIDRLWKWLHEKAMKVDKGFGEGRFAADPKAADPKAADDDIEL